MITSIPHIEKDCIVNFNGKQYEAHGAILTDERIFAYTKFPEGILQDWHGNQIGTCKIVSSWKVHSYYGRYMYQIESIFNGKTYTGRGFGNGMSYIGKLKSTKPKYQRKTIDKYYLLGQYSRKTGYEELVSEDSYKEIIKRRNEHRENEPGISFKIIKKRIPI